jgi:hypothetical protein
MTAQKPVWNGKFISDGRKFYNEYVINPVKKFARHI